MKITILCRALRSLIVALVPATGAMTQPNETTYGQLPDIPPQKEPHTKVQPIRVGFVSEWLFITLPRPGYESLAASKNGVVLLRKQDGDRQFHRWKAGETLLLTQDTDASRLLPGAAYRFINYAFSAAGAIAVAYGASDTREPIGGIKYFFRDEYINVWSANSNTAKLVQGNVQVWSDSDTGESYSAHSYQRYSRLLTIDSPIGEWSEYVTGWFTTSGEGYKLMRVTAPITSITGSESKTLFASDVVRTGANSSGDFIGYRRANPVGIVAGLINQETVDFAPAFISENGIVLGRTNSMNEASYSAFVPTDQAEVMYSYPLRRSIPLPTDGRVTWVDELDRPNGFAPDGTPAVWTPVKGANGAPLLPLQYVRQSYIPLPVPRDPAITNPADDWQINPPHYIPPDTVKNQLGIMRRGQVTQPFLAIRGGLYVDANRDGTLATGGSDATNAENPFRFWLNDDIDRLHTFSDSAPDSMAPVSETEEDDIGPVEASRFSWQPDYRDGRIESKRDLEDFSRLWIQAQGLNAAFKSGDLSLGLKWADTGSTAPAIQLYESVEADGGLGYLTDDAIAANQLLLKRNAIKLINLATGYAATQISGSATFVLPASLFANLSDTQPKTHLLFEGCAAGKGQLKLVILKLGSGSTYTEIGEGPGVWMDLKKIGDMYEHWSVGNGNGAAPDAIAARVPSSTGSSGSFSYSASSPEEQKYILFVHGWNMEKWEKERFAETAFKRLWWQGYKGRFGLFSWPCTNRYDETSTLGKIIEGVSDGTHFDRGEWTAWRSGAPLRQLLQTLNGAYNGSSYVFSHSMGGIVVSEALRLQSDAGGGQIANVYVASQAALSAHLYDATLSTAVGSASSVQWEYNHPSLPTGSRNYGPQTTNVYRNWLAYLLNGNATSSKAVGTLVNFYNQNDWALAAPVWQFNQITKPDWPDVFHSQPYRYGYTGDPAFFADAFNKRSGETIYPLALGTRANPQDRYEIMAFAAESHVKSFGAVPNVSQGITRSFDVRSIWLSDGGDHKAHIWHSAQFRSTMPKQRDYWKALLGRQAFDITTGVLP